MLIEDYDVSIELDSDLETEYQTKAQIVPGGQSAVIGKPLEVRSLRFPIDQNVRIGDLSLSAISVLCGHLNLPHCGTLRNWQSVASALGVPSEVIPGMKDTRELLKSFAKKPLDTLMDALMEINRVDTMFSLKKLHEVESIWNSRPVPGPSNPAGFGADESGIVIPGENYILVVSCALNLVEQKKVDYFVKNLKQVPKFSIPVYDIYEKINDQNIHKDVDALYSSAQQIIFCYTPTICQGIRPDSADLSMDQRLKLLVFDIVTDIMKKDYYRNGMKNKKIRPVVFPKFGEYKVADWNGITLIYRFPEDWKELILRVKDLIPANSSS